MPPKFHAIWWSLIARYVDLNMEQKIGVFQVVQSNNFHNYCNNITC